MSAAGLYEVTESNVSIASRKKKTQPSSVGVCVCRLPAHDSRDFRVVSTNFFSASFVGVLHEIARASEYVLGKP